jgi:nicotinamide-nucleotide amidase
MRPECWAVNGMKQPGSKMELISTGSELLSGRSVNAHARTLGALLAPLGMHLTRDTTIPDDGDALYDCIREALARVDVVMVTGGLGPTEDDITREVVAQYLGRKTVMDELSLEHVRECIAARGLEMNPSHERQAIVVQGAVPLSNRVGLAPGERIEWGDGKVIFLMPGPPREFLAVLEDHVLPWLRERGYGELGYRERVFMTCGIAEARLVELFREHGFPPAGLALAYCAAPGRVEVRLSATEQDDLLEQAADQLRGMLGNFLYAEERLTMAELVGRLLAARKATLATAESCTGGLLGGMLTAVSGSSEYYLGGVVSYANRIKAQQLGVDPDMLEEHGAVSEPVARAMAEGVRQQFGVDYGIGITGIAGPSGGTAAKPVGLVYIALADAAGVFVQENHFVGGRERVREWSCLTALNLLRLRLLAS